MALHSDAGVGAILNYLAGTTDLGDAAAIRRIAALVGAMIGGGSPEGVLTGSVGALYTDSTNGVLYIKATGTGNTGWTTVGGPMAGNTPGHNLLHNGAMQVHQRGTSVTGITSSGYYTADRWYGAINTIGTWTQSVENDAPTGSGFRKSLKMRITANSDATIDAADYVRILQYVEGQNLQSVLKGTASAQQLTVSFWVKSNKTGTYVVELYDVDNTRHVAATYTVVSSATWEQHTVTFPADLTGAFDNDNESSLALLFHLADGSDSTSGTLATTWAASTTANRGVGQTNLAAADDNYWQITGCQLEIGSAATGFQHKGYGQELRECQRYYFRTVAGELFGTGFCTGTTSALIRVPFPVTMRGGTVALSTTGTAADYIVYNNVGSGVASSAVPTILNPTLNLNNGFLSCSTASGLVAGNGTGLVANSGSVYLGFSADL